MDWLTQCRLCKHYYKIQADDDEVRCRLKFCRFEPRVKTPLEPKTTKYALNTGMEVNRDEYR